MIENIQNLIRLKKCVEERRPLIHCITNPISIHDCANVVLAAGGRPIMAEHPREVSQITKTSQALMLNLGNITDVRMESMKKSLLTANEEKIPVLLDLVGVSCSDMRREYAKELLRMGHISVLKGNMSEILTMAGEESHSVGIDAGAEDALTSGNLKRVVSCFREFAQRNKAVILASGKADLIVSEDLAFLVENGNEMMSEITGTGCMLGALSSTFLAGTKKEEETDENSIDTVYAVLLGTIIMGIAGEMASEISHGPGTFQISFLDALYRMEEDKIIQRGKIRSI